MHGQMNLKLPWSLVGSPHVCGLTSGRGTLFRHNNITRLQLAAIF